MKRIMRWVHGWGSLDTSLAEFNNVVFSQFEARLKDHRRQLKGDLRRSILEEAAYIRHFPLHPKKYRDSKGNLIFDLHQAKQLLRQDIANNSHLNLTPRQFQKTRVEYQEFDLKVFKRRIYQEVRRVKFINWMEYKRQQGEPDGKRVSMFE